MLNLVWSGQAADFRDSSGQLAATDPSAFESSPAALLIRQDRLEEMATTTGVTICWMVLGEKLAYLPGPMKRIGAVHVSGACALRDRRVEGFIHFIKDREHEEISDAILATKRF